MNISFLLKNSYSSVIHSLKKTKVVLFNSFLNWRSYKIVWYLVSAGKSHHRPQSQPTKLKRIPKNWHRSHFQPTTKSCSIKCHNSEISHYWHLPTPKNLWCWTSEPSYRKKSFLLPHIWFLSPGGDFVSAYPICARLCTHTSDCACACSECIYGVYPRPHDAPVERFDNSTWDATYLK